MRRLSLNKVFILILFNLSSFFLLYLFMPNATKAHSFSGNEMTMDYYIIIGRVLTDAEQRSIQKLVSATFREVDSIYNKWNPESELTKLNRLKAGEVVPLSQELENFLLLTDSIVKLSGGKFDPTIEPLQQLWKSHLSNGKMPSEVDVQTILQVVGWRHIHFGDGKFYKDHDGTSLDLGGIAKGYCVDLLVERLVEEGFNHVFVEWGGEIRAHGMHPDNRPWIIMTNCLDDEEPENAIAHISLYDQSIATSGDYIQNWKISQDGVETTFFHIIDPTTAKPLIATQKSVASATVVAPTCVLADALATVAMMYPTLSEANKWVEQICEQNPEIRFWLYSRDSD